MRESIDGKLYTLNYAAASSVAIDPIEKKPLFHFYPGSTVLSLGSIDTTSDANTAKTGTFPKQNLKIFHFVKYCLKTL